MFTSSVGARVLVNVLVLTLQPDPHIPVAEEYYGNMYRYYRRKVGPKVDVAPILVTLLTAISIFQVGSPRPFLRLVVHKNAAASLGPALHLIHGPALHLPHGPAPLTTCLFLRTPCASSSSTVNGTTTGRCVTFSRTPNTASG